MLGDAIEVVEETPTAAVAEVVDARVEMDDPLVCGGPPLPTVVVVVVVALALLRGEV